MGHIPDPVRRSQIVGRAIVAAIELDELLDCQHPWPVGEDESSESGESQSSESDSSELDEQAERDGCGEVQVRSSPGAKGVPGLGVPRRQQIG